MKLGDRVVLLRDLPAGAMPGRELPPRVVGQTGIVSERADGSGDAQVLVAWDDGETSRWVLRGLLREVSS